MKRILFVCLILPFAHVLMAQVQNVDSLENILNTQELSPEKRIQLYWDIVSYCMNNDLDKTLTYSEKGSKLAESMDNDLWSARFNRMVGFYHLKKNEHELSLAALNKSIDYAGRANDPKEEGIAQMYIAAMYQGAGKHETALKQYMELLPIFENLQLTDYYTSCLSNIAIIYQQLHNNEKALEYSKRALDIAERNDYKLQKMANYTLAGDIYAERGELDSAVVYMNKSYEISRSQNNLIQMIISSQMLAVVYSTLEDYRNAEKYAKECLEAAEQFGEKQTILMAWSVMAKINFDMKRYQESEAYAYKVWEADSTHLERAENATLYLCMSNMFLGNTQKAFSFLEEYISVRNQLSEKSLHNSLADMEVKYETEKKEMRILTLEKEKQLYIGLASVSILALLASLGLIYYRYSVHRQKRRIAEQEIATKAILDGETAERSRLARDLHDGLGGMLSVVKLNLEKTRNHSVASESDPHPYDKTMMMLDDSIAELRRIAHHMMPESLMHYGLKVSLEDFCHAIPNASFQFIGEDTRLDARLEVMIYRCAYELINNAVKYANASHIHVQLLIDKKIIALTVDDDGIGFDPDRKGSGTGLQNIQNRISAYNGRITIRSTPGKGTEIIIEIELI